ncbi:MAG TPA: hypothetical protein VH040_03745 [Usitatibacter sp.]|nr:hypothetical protein [Usitatibacter sp.]
MGRALAIACFAGFASLTVTLAVADTPPVTSAVSPAVTPPVTPAVADATTSRGPGEYEDRLIDGGKLAPLASGADQATYNPDGPARSWRVEGYGSRIEQGGTIRHENGMVLAGRLDTLQYGAFSIDATLRGAGTSSVVTLWQRGLAFDNGWVANNGLGTLNTLAIDLTRNQFRFYLPTFPVLGASTEWTHHGGDLVLQASAGQPGLYDGIRVAGFSRLGGTVATLGAQLRVDRNLTVGVQMAAANGVPSSVDPTMPSPNVSGRSLFAALQWHDATSQLQVNALDSESSDTRHNLGVWFDGEMRDGRFHHNYGMFRFEPDLAWAYTPVNRDLQGGYYRLSYSSQQWNWSAGLDGVAPVTDARGTRGWFGTGNVRYQVDTTTGVGGGGTSRTGQGPGAFAGYAYLDKQTWLGTSRAQVDVVSASGQEHSQQITLDQAWPTQVGMRLSTLLQAGVQKTPDGDTRRWSLSAFGGVDLTNTLSIDGNIRYSQDRDVARTTGLFANLGMIWKLTPKWSLLATYYDNRSDVTPFATLEPVVAVQPLPVVPRDRAIFVNVRYEDHAGTPVAPLGGMPGAGAGTLVGYVFYDANDNGRRDAAEQGAASLTVVLDGRFGTRTDKDGKFEFPLLAAGGHSITIIPDNLALPYSIPNEGRREVVVHTRETTTLEVAARKQQ